MNALRTLGAIALSAALASPALAAVRTYQVTGPVLEVKDDMIAVQKGKDRWELARDSATKGASPRVGDKVTIEYRMIATSVDVKSAAAPKNPKKK